MSQVSKKVIYKISVIFYLTILFIGTTETILVYHTLQIFCGRSILLITVLNKH